MPFEGRDVVNTAKVKVTTASIACVSAVSLSMLGALTPKAAGDDDFGVTTLRLFEHDTQQTALDLGDAGDGPGDQLLFAGDVFDRPGGTYLGHIAGQVTFLSGNAKAGDLMFAATFALRDGEIAVQTVADRAALLGRGETVPLAILGGTGIYRDARGDGTLQIPNQTDGNVVLNVIMG